MNQGEIESLLEKARRGEAEALAQLCGHFYPKMLKYMHYRVDAASAEDLTGEVFVRVLRHISDQKGSFVAWLYRIAANAATDHARARKIRRESPMDERATETIAGGDNPADVVGRQMDIRTAIARLTDDQRELVTLKFIQGLSNSEIAEITDRKQGTIRGLQFRALAALRELLGGEEKRHE
ncbi:MAG: sigma-70 family RNA polymerase sigma factor [Actinobacteria bacterium]|nr:sigma-70 family RNA polymerase sigma factor [Actinomycetota bacterium]